MLTGSSSRLDWTGSAAGRSFTAGIPPQEFVEYGLARREPQRAWRPGLLFQISQIACLDASTADVDGGYYEAGLSSSGNMYHVERRHGEWVVTKNTMHWIS